MAKYIKPDEIGALIIKKQGKKSDVVFAKELKITRQTLRNVRAGQYLPRPEVCTKLGIEFCYRVTG